MNFIIEDWWVTCEMYTFVFCTFANISGNHVLHLYLFIACMEHRRDFSHICSLVWLLELGFGTTSTSVLLFNACAISCCSGAKYLIVQ